MIGIDNQIKLAERSPMVSLLIRVSLLCNASTNRLKFFYFSIVAESRSPTHPP